MDVRSGQPSRVVIVFPHRTAQHRGRLCALVEKPLHTSPPTVDPHSPGSAMLGRTAKRWPDGGSVDDG